MLCFMWKCIERQWNTLWLRVAPPCGTSTNPMRLDVFCCWVLFAGHPDDQLSISSSLGELYNSLYVFMFNGIFYFILQCVHSLSEPIKSNWNEFAFTVQFQYESAAGARNASGTSDQPQPKCSRTAYTIGCRWHWRLLCSGCAFCRRRSHAHRWKSTGRQ